jgi:hypothetical protein
LVGGPEEQIKHGRPRRREVGNIRTDLRQIWWEVVVDWIHLAQEWDQWRVLVNTVMNIWIPENVGHFLKAY